jgi:hypothetical protein
MRLLGVAALLAILATRTPLAQSVLPDPASTPGAPNPLVTQATIGSTICIRGWTMTVRPSQQCTSALKRQQEEGTRENWTTEEIDKRLRESFGRRHQAVIQLLNLDTRLPIVPGMVLSHLLHRCPVQIAANACEARQVFGRYIPERPIGATAQKRDIALLLFWGGLTSTGSISVATVTPITVTRRIQLLPYYCP